MKLSQELKQQGLTKLFIVSRLWDGWGLDLRDGAVACQDGKIIAVGPADELRQQYAQADRMEDFGTKTLIPPLVNAHTHLDLTLARSLPFEGSFIDWLASVFEARRSEASDVSDTVLTGLACSRQAGVGIVGDIAGSVEAMLSLATAEQGLWGVSFAEVFGDGEQGLERLESLAQRSLEAWQSCEQRKSGIRLGLSPHAPYSVSSVSYQRARAIATEHGLSLQTHLAETPEESQYLQTGDGPLMDLRERFGHQQDEGMGVMPLQMLEKAWGPSTASSVCSIAHGNTLMGSDAEVLKELSWGLVYCPRASHYFEHSGHPYRDLLSAGVAVAIGTDSSMCHPNDPYRGLSVLDELRFLCQRDEVEAATLLTMGTRHGVTALGLPEEWSQLAVGSPSRMTLLESDDLEQAIRLGQASLIES